MKYFYLIAFVLLMILLWSIIGLAVGISMSSGLFTSTPIALSNGVKAASAVSAIIGVAFLLIIILFIALKIDEAVFVFGVPWVGALSGIFIWSPGIYLVDFFIGLFLGWFVGFRSSLGKIDLEIDFKRNDYIYGMQDVARAITPLTGALTAYILFNVNFRNHITNQLNGSFWQFYKGLVLSTVISGAGAWIIAKLFYRK